MNSSILYHNDSEPPTVKQLKKVIRKLSYPEP